MPWPTKSRKLAANTNPIKREGAARVALAAGVVAGQSTAFLHYLTLAPHGPATGRVLTKPMG